MDPPPHITEQDHYWEEHFISKTVTIEDPNHPIKVELRYTGSQPTDAFICPLHDPSEPDEVPSDGAAHSAHLLRSLLRYLHEKYPSLTHVRFEDQSIVYPEDPLPLRYFWLAFGSQQTWFEEHFGAIYQSAEAHATYRQKVEAFFSTKIPPFSDFVWGFPERHRLMEDTVLFQEVEALYRQDITYQELLDSIPKERWFIHAMKWVIYWVEDIVKWHMSRYGWRIPLPLRDTNEPHKQNQALCTLPIVMDGGYDLWRAQFISISDLED